MQKTAMELLDQMIATHERISRNLHRNILSSRSLQNNMLLHFHHAEEVTVSSLRQLREKLVEEGK